MTPLVTAFALGPTVEIIERLSGWRSVELAFRSAGIPLEVIGDRRVFIPYAAEALIVERAARFTGEANLGSIIGRDFPFKDLGTYGQYVMAASDLTTALLRASRGIRYATNCGRFFLQSRDDKVRITYDSGIAGAAGSQHIHCGTVELIIDVIRCFAGSSWAPLQVELDQSKRADGANKLEQLIGAPIRFDRPYPAVVFQKSLLSCLNPHPPAIHNQLTFSDLKRMVRSSPGGDMSSTVRALLELRLLQGQVDVEGVALTLNLGPRTLQRRLENEGLSYRELIDAVRLQKATELLSETSKQVGDIALSLGYSSPGHFVRAFRRWTGTTPAAYRLREVSNV